MTRPLAVVLMAAGLGKRTRVSLPKVLLPLCGRTVIGTLLDVVEELKPERTVLVLHHGRERVVAALEKSGHLRAGVTIVDQGEPRGTGHAVQVALAEALADFHGELLVLNGDCPLVTVETLAALRDARGDGAAAILTSIPDDPTGLGRVIRAADGSVARVREHRDCSIDELAIGEINAGSYAFDVDELRPALARIDDRNAQRELYLTDVLHLLVASGRSVRASLCEDPGETQGINTLAELALARDLMQERILLHHLANGVVIEDPATTYIDHGVEIGADTRILPCTVIRTGVRIGRDCEVGPFAHLRVATELADGAEIGNFVEAKNTKVGAHTKAKHLTYLGDCTIGAKANIGAGTITANYDGKHKHQTTIGDRAFIGSGTVLVAPTTIGNGAMTGAGAVVRRGTNVAEREVYVGVPARLLRKLPAVDVPESGAPESNAGGGLEGR
jgi:bifunctional UDP-N-acetylglucosamine pyrophosphorylase/glucosamine-1-phosphate N-acetyltransferase